MLNFGPSTGSSEVKVPSPVIAFIVCFIGTSFIAVIAPCFASIRVILRCQFISTVFLIKIVPIRPFYDVLGYHISFNVFKSILLFTIHV
jgi:hypothetical protein